MTLKVLLNVFYLVGVFSFCHSQLVNEGMLIIALYTVTYMHVNSPDHTGAFNSVAIYNRGS